MDSNVSIEILEGEMSEDWEWKDGRRAHPLIRVVWDATPEDLLEIGNRIAKMAGIEPIGKVRLVGPNKCVAPKMGVEDWRVRRAIRLALGKFCPVWPNYTGDEAVCSLGNTRCINPEHLIGATDRGGRQKKSEKIKEPLRKIALEDVVEPLRPSTSDPEEKRWEIDPDMYDVREKFLTAPIDHNDVQLLIMEYGSTTMDMVEEIDGCWLMLKGNPNSVRRELADRMGLYPADAYKDDPDLPHLHGKTLRTIYWAKTSCGRRRCIKPGHIVISNGRWTLA